MKKTINSKDKLAFYRELSENFSLIPLKGKRPVEKGWTRWCKDKRLFEQKDFQDRNAGVACGPASGVLVVDVDDPKQFEGVCEKNGWSVHEAYTVLTGSGKPHYYFQYPQNGNSYGNRSFKKLGFDIRGVGGVIVAPGSIHPDTGEPYCVFNDVPIAQAPKWLLDLFEEHSQTDDSDFRETVIPCEVDIEQLSISDEIKSLIVEGMPKGKRSEAIMSVINALVGIVLSDERIFWIFEEYPIGEKYREKGISKVKWLKNQIIKAEKYQKSSSPEGCSFFQKNKFVPTKLINQIKRQYDIFHDGNEFYFYDDRKGLWVAQHDSAIGQIILGMLGEKAKQSYVKETIYLLSCETFKPADELKQVKQLINLSNGILDILNGELLPHNKKYYSKVQIPVSYEPDAKYPRFLKFLNELFPDDPQKIHSLQDFAGYILYPKIFIHKCLFMVGSGANGKSVFINILTKIIGRENISALELHQLSNRFLLGNIKDKLLNVSSEVQTKSPVDGSIFKQVVSGDLVQADRKFKDPFSFRPIAKHIFSMNEPPVIIDRTYAMVRRLIILKFNQTFSGENEDKRLEDKLSEELPGILNWCLEGLAKMLKNETIFESNSMEEDKKEFMRSINPVLHFVDEVCVLDAEALIGKDELYQNYKSWCDESGLRPLSKIKFYDQLKRDYPGIIETRPDGGSRCFKGIDLSHSFAYSNDTIIGKDILV